MNIHHLSHSSVQTFQGCPRRWSYKQAGVEVERTPVVLAFGVAVHDGAAAKSERAFTGCGPADVGQTTFAGTWDSMAAAKAAPLHLGSASADELRVLGHKLIDVYEPPSRLLGVEQPVEIRLADDLPPIHGRVDLLYQDEGGGLVVADLKTSCTRVISDTASVEAQLSLYSEAFPGRLEAIVLAKLKTPVATVQPITPWPRERLVNLYRETYAAMKAGVRYAVRSTTMCPSCPYRDRCERDH